MIAAIMILALGGCGYLEPTLPAYHLTGQYSVADPQFARAVGGILGPSLKPYNHVTILNNGDEILPAMLAAIESAEHSVTLETYIYSPGIVADRFTEALAARARDGVAVHVLVDAAGSGDMSGAHRRRLERAGSRVARYHALRWFDLRSAAKLNHRTHRKILVVDGRIGFIGGANIGDQWLGRAESPRHWREIHCQVQGPVVAQLQAVFAENWAETTGEVIAGRDYFPPLEPAGFHAGHIFATCERSTSATMELMYLMSIHAARDSIRIANAYFLPSSRVQRALEDACARGVRVQIIVPGPHMDQVVVSFASRACWDRLLKAGVEIYEYQPTMMHAKVLIVDGQWVSIGSANLDNRSTALNDEANLNILDAGIGAEMNAIFDADLVASKRVQYDRFAKRTVLDRLVEASLSIFALRDQM